MKAEVIKTKKLSIEQYLDKNKPYLSDLINENNAIENDFNEWKILFICASEFCFF